MRVLPPVKSLPSPEIFRAMGEQGLKDLLRAVYSRLGASPIAELFPVGEEALAAASEKSALFFIGICGGPPLFEQKYGPPQMRARHARFRINDAARLAWLDCWKQVLESAETYGFPLAHKAGFWEYLETFSQWMVNVE